MHLACSIASEGATCTAGGHTQPCPNMKLLSDLIEGQGTQYRQYLYLTRQRGRDAVKLLLRSIGACCPLSQLQFR